MIRNGREFKWTCLFITSILLKTVVYEFQFGLKCPKPVLDGMTAGVKSVVCVQILRSPVGVKSGRPMLKSPKVTRDPNCCTIFLGVLSPFVIKILKVK